LIYSASFWRGGGTLIPRWQSKRAQGCQDTVFLSAGGENDAALIATSGLDATERRFIANPFRFHRIGMNLLSSPYNYKPSNQVRRSDMGQIFRFAGHPLQHNLEPKSCSRRLHHLPSDW
jgi:hypothetical protein